MKGISLLMWTLVIVGSLYIVSSFFGNFDVSKINPNTKEAVFGNATTSQSVATSTQDNDTVSTTSAKRDLRYFDFDGVLYKKTDFPTSFKKIFTPTGSIYVKISDNEQKREQGLSGVVSMDKDVGMLFIFDDNNVRSFWMKDMNFPLDIVWIDANKKVVGIAENVLQESYPNPISSVAPAKYVLELNALMAKKIGLKAGARITF